MARPASVQAWVSKAVEDEQVLHALHRLGGPWAAAAYHAQQAAEKYAKAAILATGKAPRHTHDITLLLSAVGVAVPPDAQVAAATLTVFATITRYPGGPDIGEPEVTEAINELAKIKAWALAIIDA